MNDEAATPGEDELFRAYGVAVVEFNAASATLILQLAAKSLPTKEQIAREENARSKVVDTRRKLWALYARA